MVSWELMRFWFWVFPKGSALCSNDLLTWIPFSNFWPRVKSVTTEPWLICFRCRCIDVVVGVRPAVDSSWRPMDIHLNNMNEWTLQNYGSPFYWKYNSKGYFSVINHAAVAALHVELLCTWLQWNASSPERDWWKFQFWEAKFCPTVRMLFYFHQFSGYLHTWNYALWSGNVVMITITQYFHFLTWWIKWLCWRRFNDRALPWPWVATYP